MEPEPSPLEAENAALRTETARLQREVVTLKGLLAEQTRVAAAAEAAAMQSSLQRTIAALEEEEGAAEGAGADERWSGSDTAAAGACVLCNLVIGCALAAAAAILLMAEPATSPCRQVEQAGASMLPACAGSLLAAAAATGRGRPLPPHVCGESPPPWAQAVLRTAGLCERPERPAADAEGERATPPLLSMEVEHGGVFVLGRRFFGSAARLAIWEGEEPGQVAEVRACVRRWRRLGLTRGVCGSAGWCATAARRPKTLAGPSSSCWWTPRGRPPWSAASCHGRIYRSSWAAKMCRWLCLKATTRRRFALRRRHTRLLP